MRPGERPGPGRAIVFEDTLQPFVEVSCDGRARVRRSPTRRSSPRARGDFDAGARAARRERLRCSDVRTTSAAGRTRSSDARYLELAPRALRRRARRASSARSSCAAAPTTGAASGSALSGLGLVDTAPATTKSAEQLLAEARDLFRRAGDRWGLTERAVAHRRPRGRPRPTSTAPKQRSRRRWPSSARRAERVDRADARAPGRGGLRAGRARAGRGAASLEARDLYAAKRRRDRSSPRVDERLASLLSGALSRAKSARLELRRRHTTKGGRHEPRHSHRSSARRPSRSCARRSAARSSRPRTRATTRHARSGTASHDGQRPALIVRCTGAADVIAAVGFARSNDLPSRSAAAATASPASRPATTGS